MPSLFVKDISERFFWEDDLWVNHTNNWLLSENGLSALSRAAENYIGPEFPINYEGLSDEARFDFLRTWKYSGSLHLAEFLEKQTPIYDYVHLLSNKPSIEAIESCYIGSGNVVLVSDQNENHYIALTTVGADCTECIAYAYLKVDGRIPADILENLERNNSFDMLKADAAKELREFLRRNQSNQVTFCSTFEDKEALQNMTKGHIYVVGGDGQEIDGIVKTLPAGSHLVSAFNRDNNGENLRKKLESVVKDEGFAVWVLSPQGISFAEDAAGLSQEKDRVPTGNHRDI